MVDAGIMSVSGASYVIYNEDGSEFKKFVGKNKYRQFMTENPDIFNSLMDRLGNRGSTVVQMSDDEVDAAQEEEEAIKDMVKNVKVQKEE